MRLGFVVHGIVQGVGFQPFVHRTAAAHGLRGWVQNEQDVVRLEVQGPEAAVSSFSRALERDAPPTVRILNVEREAMEESEDRDFRVLDSEIGPSTEPLLPPDLATCAECWGEVRSAGRRFHYPFTNCAHCGPRFSIARSLPYDRQGTTMQGFRPCVDCQREYFDFSDRRYHAEPIACPRCGPELTFFDGTKQPKERGDAALRRAASAIREGRIVALKGLGGFQLLCDAENGVAVARLRARKRRPHKPFAVLFRGPGHLAESACVTDAELRLLVAPEAPIVLLERRPDAPISLEVCADSPEVGAMLPYTPLHGLLASEVRRPLVCTSANLSDEPVCTTLEETMDRLGRVADCYLSHNRPIARAVEDSIVRCTTRGATMVRRARGYAPLPVARVEHGVSVLAFGAERESTVTLGHHGFLVMSQHFGDLTAPGSRQLLEQSTEDLRSFFDATIDRIASDQNPDYVSTKVAGKVSERLGVPNVRVQHHHAHVAAVVAEHALAGPVLGFAWDEGGRGIDGSVWGSEALVCEGNSFQRFAHLSAFPLLGAGRAALEPCRAALGALFALCPDAIDSHLKSAFGADLPRLRFALERDAGTTSCSSMGRWFDVVAALSGVSLACTFHGQAAMRLAALAATSDAEDGYLLPLETGHDGVIVGNAGLMLRRVCFDSERSLSPARIARRFHQGLIDFGVRVAERAGIAQVVLSGGSFQNRFLLEGLSDRLEKAGFSVFHSRQVPLNDGGISLGQAWIAAHTPLHA